MSEDGIARIWVRLEELKELMTRVLAIQEEREKLYSRHEHCLNLLTDRVRQLEINQGRWSVLAAMISAVLTAGAVKFFVG